MPNLNIATMPDLLVQQGQAQGLGEATGLSGSLLIGQKMQSRGNEWSVVFGKATVKQALIGEKTKEAAVEEKPQQASGFLTGQTSQESGETTDTEPAKGSDVSLLMENGLVAPALPMNIAVETMSQEGLLAGSQTPIDEGNGVATANSSLGIKSAISGALQQKQLTTVMTNVESASIFGKSSEATAQLFGQPAEATAMASKLGMGPFGSGTAEIVGQANANGSQQGKQATIGVGKVIDPLSALSPVGQKNLSASLNNERAAGVIIGQPVNGTAATTSEAGVQTASWTTTVTNQSQIAPAIDTLVGQSSGSATMDGQTVKGILSSEVVISTPLSSETQTTESTAAQPQAVRQLFWQDLQARMFGQIKQAVSGNETSSLPTTETRASVSGEATSGKTFTLPTSEMTAARAASIRTQTATMAQTISSMAETAEAMTSAIAVEGAEPTITLSESATTSAFITDETNKQVRKSDHSFGSLQRSIQEGSERTAAQAVTSVSSTQDEAFSTEQLRNGAGFPSTEEATVKTAHGRRETARQSTLQTGSFKAVNAQTMQGDNQATATAATLDDTGAATQPVSNEGLNQAGKSSFNPQAAAAVSSTDHSRGVGRTTEFQTVESRGKELAESIQTIEKLTAITGRTLLQKAQEGGGSIRLQLEPPELGHMKLEIQVTKDGVKAEAVVENGLVRQTLMDNIPQLRQVLLDKGLELQRFDVFQQMSQNTSREGWSEGQTGGDGYAYDEPETEKTSNGVKQRQRTSYAMRGMAGNINLFA